MIWRLRPKPDIAWDRTPAKTPQMSKQATVELHVRLLRAWHLAILRFALTRENADRLGVLAIANEIDRLGRPQDADEGFSFFRRTSAELSAAILRRRQGDEVILREYLAGIDDARLLRALAAALEMPQPEPALARKDRGPHQDLWRGLPSRANARP
jgi:hypothetical protein